MSASLKEMLLRGVEQGYWTLENLDSPSAGWGTNTRVDLRTFPDGYKGAQHRNLLRDGMPQPERVQVIDPKDLPPMAQGVTPPEALNLPTTLDDNEWF